MKCESAKSHIFPYVDDELAPELREELEAHLARCPGCRQLVGHERAFRDAYVSRLRPDPAPAHLRQTVDRLLESLHHQRRGVRRRRRALVLRAVTAAVLLVGGAAVGMALDPVLVRRDVLAELTEASVIQHQKLASGLLPHDVVAASPGEAAAWLRARVDFNVELPELKTPNLTLLGGRVSHLANVPVAALEYRLDDKSVSLFVIPGDAYGRLGLSEKPKFKIRRHRGYDVIIWRQHGTGYTLVSEVGGRSCLVCHSPDEKIEAPPDHVDSGGASPAQPRRTES
jgi:anti-sigma factor (TIGR02949 family)